MGQYTQHGYFYKPAYDERGLDNCNKFNNALEAADGVIDTLDTDVNTGKINSKTTSQIQTIVNQGTASDVRIFFNTTRNALEIWIGFSLAKVL